MNQQPSISSVALVVHSAQLGSETTMSVVAHDIHHRDTKSILGPGRVFSTQDKQSLISLLAEHMNTSLEMLNPLCLATSQETMMWYRPRSKRLINIMGKELEVPLPPLAFLLHRRQLHIVSFRGDKRPDSDTKLYTSGLPNVYLDGKWCSGGNVLPANPSQKDIETIENRFFMSPFTHWNGGSANKAGDMEQFFTDLTDKRTFPTSRLKPVPSQGFHSDTQTLGRWMHEIVKE